MRVAPWRYAYRLFLANRNYKFYFRILVLFHYSWYKQFLIRIKTIRIGYFFKRIDIKSLVSRDHPTSIIIFGSGESICSNRELNINLSNSLFSVGLNFFTVGKIHTKIQMMEFSRQGLENAPKKFASKYSLYNESLSLLVKSGQDLNLLLHISCVDEKFFSLVPESKNIESKSYYDDIPFFLCREKQDFKDHIDAIFWLRNVGFWPKDIYIGPISLLKAIDFSAVNGFKSIYLAGFDGGGKNFWEFPDMVKDELLPYVKYLGLGGKIHSNYLKPRLPLSDIIVHLEYRLMSSYSCVLIRV